MAAPRVFAGAAIAFFILCLAVKPAGILSLPCEHRSAAHHGVDLGLHGVDDA